MKNILGCCCIILLLELNLSAQNVGIGTASPTARLDVNGSLRFRTGASMGRTLVSDADGNATWQTNFAFRAQGLLNNELQVLTLGQWNRVFFNQSARYNVGLMYQTGNAQFSAPYKGIYHFNTQLLIADLLKGYTEVRIQVRRGNNTFAIAESKYVFFDNVKINSTVLYTTPISLVLDVQLEANDLVYVEVKPFQENGSSIRISPTPSHTWFAGHLITRVP